MEDDIRIDISGYANLTSQVIENEETGDVEESSLGKTTFGRYRYFHIPVEYKAGDPGFPLPGVYDDRYDAASQTSIRQPGAFMVTGMTPAISKKFVNIIVVEATDKNGKAYHRVDKHPGFTELWREHQWPALRALPKAQLDALQATGPKAMELLRQGRSFTEINQAAGTWVYAKSSLVESPIKRTKQDGTEGKTHFRTDWTIYATEAEMKAAESAFWAERGGSPQANGAAPTFDAARFPAMWAKASNMPQVLYDKINAELKAGKEAKAAAIASMVMNPDGTPKTNADGMAVDVAWIFGQATGLPAEMYTFG